MTDLKRLVLDYRSGELVVRCLYRTEGEAGPNTKARWREENRGGWLSWYRWLERGYLERAAECGRRAEALELDTASEPKGA
jgi:hypothetical protein